MNASRPKLQAVLPLAIILLSALPAYSQSFGDGYYRLTTKWQGDEKSLDVVNQDDKSQVHLAGTKEKQVGQKWKFTPVGGGYFRITNEWQGDERVLEVAGGGNRDKIRLADKANITGQHWRIEPLGDGYYRFTTKWLGAERSLDIVNDDHKKTPTMAETSDAEGQFWKITPLSSAAFTATIRPLKDFKPTTIRGFTVNIHPELADRPGMAEALERVDEDLKVMIRILKPAQITQLRKVPIWMQYKLVERDGLMWYHTSKDWLISEGYPVELENSVEISNINALLELEKGKPYGMLHEFSHAFQDLYIPGLQAKLKEAFNQAVESKKYEKVAHENGSTLRAYALTDETEYFAELSEAYFGMNDYYPFKRTELEEFDKLGYRLMQEAWGE